MLKYKVLQTLRVPVVRRRIYKNLPTYFAKTPLIAKCMGTSKRSIRCKLVFDRAIVHQKIKFTYPGIEISRYENVRIEVRQKTTKAAR